MPEVVLNVSNISHFYRAASGFWGRRSVRALDDVSLKIHRGEIVGIVGESGSGKTTISKIMMGLLTPTSGTVELDGRSISEQSRRDIARRIQFVFQDPYASLNPRQSIGRIISQPLKVHGIGTSVEQAKAAREALDVVGLSSRIFDAYPNQLSGGQRQRVAIARALILKPDILICDEPTSALDVSVQSQVLNLLLDLRKEFDLTYVMVSHNLSVIEHMASRVAVMYLGRIVELNVSEAIFSAPVHPYTKLLLDSAMTVAPGAGIPDMRITEELRENLRQHPPAITSFTPA
ncbi:ATP-binding cassette domain-containing protein [Aliihoeflea sp. 40Bstr573]|uniref:ATP-binding cassette domain-containing protein n=1 Tax=Aliihoeflea sp. 40Bstr573 TaxID=2696467 RepID=UPI002094DDC8|nr:ATP-binding cassette domain-containing protein [Aliihoeflea sp. 40Bstr573]MCO6388784.1 ATP-binding cassette domain-containing protein [Aliihoeflea sp. 40Bstr573]